jgi:hypothetical protein
MPDDARRFRIAERISYVSDPCPKCGGPTIAVWRDVTKWPEPDMWWKPIGYRCTDDDC